MHDVDLSSAPLIIDEKESEPKPSDLSYRNGQSVPKPTGNGKKPSSGRWVRRADQIILIGAGHCVEDNLE